ncbi:MAG: outer membrane lipoprotein carrier protein LolA [Candidatus Manganitrophaceae bacterium]
MKKIWMTSLLLSLLLSLPFTSVGAAPEAGEKTKEDPAAAASQIQIAYEKLTDLQADFVQTVRFQDFDTPYVSKGKLFLKKGKMRWDYQEPTRQQIVVEGEKVTYYVPEHKQVIRSRIGGGSDSHLPLQLLSGAGRLDRDFQISIDEGSPAGPSRPLRLVPKSKEAQVTKIVVSAAPSRQIEGSVIEKVILFEENGNVSTFTFDKIEINKGFPEDLFSLKIPKGTETVDAP